MHRVLHIGKYFDPHRGGMEAFLRSLMAEQQRQGVEVRALVHRSDPSLASRTETVLWQGEALKITRAARWFTAAFAPISPTFGLQLGRLIGEYRPQVLHLHLPNLSAFWCLLLPGARRIPWVIHWHADVVASTHKRSLRLLYRLYRIPERWLLRRADTIIATSPPYLEASEPLADFKSKCTVVPLGIEGDTAPAIGIDSEEPGNSPPRVDSASRLKVLAVGRLTYYKGFNYLLRAVADVQHAELTLVGDGEERASLMAEANALGLGPRLNYLSDCDDDTLRRLYASHDVLCLPSIERTEAFGMVLLEAMREGTPCIVTEVEGSGMAWVVDAPQAGLSVPCEDSAALAKMLSTLSSDRAMLRALRQSAQSRFNSLFHITAIGQSITDVYAKAQAGES